MGGGPGAGGREGGEVGGGQGEIERGKYHCSIGYHIMYIRVLNIISLFVD